MLDLNKLYQREIKDVAQEVELSSGPLSYLWNTFSSFWAAKPKAVAQIGDLDHQNLVACFNSNYGKTLDIWLDGCSEEDKMSALYWLMTSHEGLISTANLGDLLSEPLSDRYTWIEDLRASYLNQRFNFSDKPIAEAFKMFLESDFKLPGEAQKIDRLMQSFAHKYLADNPNHPCIENKDAAYVLAFAIIMLSTDLHNSSIKNKMTSQSFMNNLRGTNNEKDFDSDFLLEIYNFIKANKIIRTNDQESAVKLVADFKSLQSITTKQQLSVTLETLPEALLAAGDGNKHKPESTVAIINDALENISETLVFAGVGKKRKADESNVANVEELAPNAKRVVDLSPR